MPAAVFVATMRQTPVAHVADAPMTSADMIFVGTVIAILIIALITMVYLAITNDGDHDKAMAMLRAETHDRG